MFNCMNRIHSIIKIYNNTYINVYSLKYYSCTHTTQFKGIIIMYKIYINFKQEIVILRND